MRSGHSVRQQHQHGPETQINVSGGRVIRRPLLFRRFSAQALQGLRLAGDADVGAGDDAAPALANNAAVGPHRAAGNARLRRRTCRHLRQLWRGRCHGRVGGDSRDHDHGRGQARHRAHRDVCKWNARHRRLVAGAPPAAEPACVVARKDNGKLVPEKHNCRATMGARKRPARRGASLPNGHLRK
jgi:hypothetical protein